MGKDLPNLPEKYVSGKHWNCFLEFVETEYRQYVYEELKKKGAISVYGVRNNLVLIGGAKLARFLDAYNAVLQSRGVKVRKVVYALDRKTIMKLMVARPDLEIGYVTWGVGFLSKVLHRIRNENHIEKRRFKTFDFGNAQKKGARAVFVSDDSLPHVLLEVGQKDILDKIGNSKIYVGVDKYLKTKIENQLRTYGFHDEITNEDKFIEPLSRALKDDLWQVREDAAAILAWMANTKAGNAKAFELLIQVLTDENQHAFVRRQALIGVGKTGNVRAVEILSHIIKKSKDWKIEGRYSYVPALEIAIEYLAQIGGSEVVEPLVRALRDDDSSVRREAAKALGEIGDKKALEPLKHALKDQFSSVREEATTALEKLANLRPSKSS
ncbi:MAG: HEAT repeat domain-containing protein [Chloroflexi bacterium]|nr:HEAT repeat domain-containing protein [Chloroflexota bacterium]